MPVSVYISLSGWLITPSDIRVWLTTPLSESSVIQAKVRTTMPVSIGASTAISSSACPVRLLMRAIQCASG